MTTEKENYLKAIYDLVADDRQIQISQIADSLMLSRASVSRMIRRLEQDGLLIHEKYGPVLLTREGMKTAETIIIRNQLIQKFLTQVLGLNQEIALKDACQIEHAISHITTTRLAEYLQMLECNQVSSKRS